MDLGMVVLILIVLACPITMFWAMRRKHGQAASEQTHPDARADVRVETGNEKEVTPGQ